jgi:UDP-N-acetylmuramate dehydrogenase
MMVRHRVPLAPHTTFQVGGEAEYFVSANSVEEVYEALHFAKQEGVSVHLFGGGSNVLVADAGWKGLILQPRLTTIKVADECITVGAGVVWDEFVVWAAEHEWSGVEALSGIPGMLGGGVVQNLGAYGQDLGERIETVRVIDTVTGEDKSLTQSECAFAYHDSLFGKESGRYIVCEATLRLSRGLATLPHYADNRFDLTKLAHSKGSALTPHDIRNAVLAIREEKGTLAHCYKSAGSFFHMPFVTSEQYVEIQRRAEGLDREKEERLRPWAWEQADGSYKIAPGFLLEYTEFQKGYVRGSVGVSPKHTLTIINRGGARASEVALLARDMQRAVENIFSLTLMREVEYIGDVERVL